MNRIKQADQAVRLNELICGCIAMVLAFMALGFCAIVGMERQEHAQRLALPDNPNVHSWTAYPADDVPRDVWMQIPTTGETWPVADTGD